jgi:hypothetical protein
MTPRAYLDMNVLITCAGEPDRCQRLVRMHKGEYAEVVISPWHLYEMGKGEPDEVESVASLLDLVEPLRLLDRADLLIFEFAEAWTRFWHQRDFEFSPIGSLDYILQAMHPRSRNTYSIREPVKLLHYERGRERIAGMLDGHRLVSRNNQERIRKGSFASGLDKRTEFRFACNHLARCKVFLLVIPKFNQVSDGIGSDPLKSDMIRFF